MSAPRLPVSYSAPPASEDYLRSLPPYSYTIPTAPVVSPHTGTQAMLTTEALAEWHLETLLNGIRGVIRSKVLRAGEERMQRQLFRILKKLDIFSSEDYFERKLALYTACQLVRLFRSSQFCIKHEEVMQHILEGQVQQDLWKPSGSWCARKMVLHGLFHQIMRRRIQQRACRYEDRTKLNRRRLVNEWLAHYFATLNGAPSTYSDSPIECYSPTDTSSFMGTGDCSLNYTSHPPKRVMHDADQHLGKRARPDGDAYRHGMAVHSPVYPCYVMCPKCSNEFTMDSPTDSRNQFQRYSFMSGTDSHTRLGHSEHPFSAPPVFISPFPCYSENNQGMFVDTQKQPYTHVSVPRSVPSRCQFISNSSDCVVQL